jgi:hypothetical protein
LECLKKAGELAVSSSRVDATAAAVLLFRLAAAGSSILTARALASAAAPWSEPAECCWRGPEEASETMDRSSSSSE